MEQTDQPRVILEIDKQQRLELGKEQLVWVRPKRAPESFALSSLRGVRLRLRPTWETLPIAAIFAVGVYGSEVNWVKIAFGSLAGLCVAACFIQLRVSLLLERDSGNVVIPLGVSMEGSATFERAKSLHQTLAQELKAPAAGNSP